MRRPAVYNQALTQAPRPSVARAFAQERNMTFKTPDFRHMTEEELRAGIAALNKTIKPLRKLEKKEEGEFWAVWSAGTLTVAGLTVVFPPAALIAISASTVLTLDKSIKASTVRRMRQDAETLRDKFKTVYRARPGRKQFNIDARRTREAERKKQKRRFKFPGFGRK
jgi:hypothetical protein